jgi:hypothetical protein
MVAAISTRSTRLASHHVDVAGILSPAIARESEDGDETTGQTTIVSPDELSTVALAIRSAPAAASAQ